MVGTKKVDTRRETLSPIYVHIYLHCNGGYRYRRVQERVVILGNSLNKGACVAHPPRFLEPSLLPMGGLHYLEVQCVRESQPFVKFPPSFHLLAVFPVPRTQKGS
jgi:hypothetical protein